MREVPSGPPYGCGWEEGGKFKQGTFLLHGPVWEWILQHQQFGVVAFSEWPVQGLACPIKLSEACTKLTPSENQIWDATFC